MNTFVMIMAALFLFSIVVGELRLFLDLLMNMLSMTLILYVTLILLIKFLGG